MKAPMMLSLRSTAVLAALILFVMASSARSQTPLGTYDEWEALTDKDGGKTVCYIGSMPQKRQGKYKKRDDTYVLITHRPAEKRINELSVQAGYTYKKLSDVEVTIGKQVFELFTDGQHAFAKDSEADKKLVKAMIHGTIMIVRGTSSRGTLTTDTYSLKGFTAAYEAIGKACKV